MTIFLANKIQQILFFFTFTSKTIVHKNWDKNFSHFYIDLILWRARKSASKVKIFFSVYTFFSLFFFFSSFFKVSSILVIFPAPLKKVDGGRKYLFLVSSNRLIFRVLVRIIALWIFLDFRSLARSFSHSHSSLSLVSHQSMPGKKLHVSLLLLVGN